MFSAIFFELTSEIYIIGMVILWNTSTVFSDQKFSALQQEHIVRICCSEKILKRYGINNA